MTRDAIPWTPEDAPAGYDPYANLPATGIYGAGALAQPPGRAPPPHLCRDPQVQAQQQAQYQAWQVQQQGAAAVAAATAHLQPHMQHPPPHGMMPPGARAPLAGAAHAAEDYGVSLKGSVLDKRRKKGQDPHADKISASAAYAKKMAEQAAAVHNAARAQEEDDGEADPITGEVSPRVPMVCNEAYNLNPILRENILASEYFKTLAEITTFDDLIDEIYNKVTYATPFIPNTRSPSSCFCLLYRCCCLRCISLYISIDIYVWVWVWVWV